MAEQTGEVFLRLSSFDEEVGSTRAEQKPRKKQKPTKKKRRCRNSSAIIQVFLLIILILAILAITFVALYARERNNCNGAREVKSSKDIKKECLTNNLPTEPIHQTDANCTTDIDECSTGKSNCHENAKCINTFGSYVCSCKSGFYENGNECIAVKECSTNESPTAPSRPSDAIAETNCTTGIDKCLTEKSACDQNAECINTLGSFICSCKTGFYGNGKKCTDVDECLIGKSPCHKYATCNNTVGSYLCSCQTGFSGTGTSCTDIDECLTTSHSCHQDARCNNTVGSYDCSCKTGFTGDGVSCADSKECLNIFTEPSYNCVCKIGSTGKEISNCTDPKYAMQFSGKQNDSSVVRVEAIPSMDKFSVCLWIQTNQSSDIGFLSYYADSTSRFNLYVQDDGTMGLNIGPVPYSLAKISDGKWHHVCYSWSSDEGHVVVYIDRKLDLEDFVILKNRTLIGGGDFVIGQYRGYDGKVDGSYTTSGKITQLHFWNRVLTAKEIIAMSNTCLPPYRGNLVSWQEFRHNTLC